MYLRGKMLFNLEHERRDKTYAWNNLYLIPELSRSTSIDEIKALVVRDT